MASFELIDPTPGASAPPGPWQARPAPPAAFSAGSAPAQTIWRATLADDPAAAAAELDRAELSLRAQEAALEAAVGRMAFAARGGASFAQATPAPERELLLVLSDLRRPTGGQSFGVGGADMARWQEAAEQFRAFAAQVAEAARSYAVVETRQAGGLFGQTRVGWGGDLRSLVLAGIGAEQRELHRRNLALALRSRAAMLRTFGIVTRGAGVVATAISSPAGPLLALPAAWKFVRQLLDEMHAGA